MAAVSIFMLTFAALAGGNVATTEKTDITAMIRNILFDMGGVVFRQDTEEALRRFRAVGVDTDRYMGVYGQKGFFLDLELGKIDADEFCRQLAVEAGRESVAWAQAQHCWLGFIRDVPMQRLDALTTLRKKYRLCLASNTNPFIMAFTRSAGFCQAGKPIGDFFDRMYCSYEMGVCKPDAEFFQRILTEEGVGASECVFVDDSESNILAARRLGIHGLHVAPDADWRGALEALLAALNP